MSVSQRADIEEYIDRVSAYTRAMDLEREPIPGGAKFMAINGLIRSSDQTNLDHAQTLVDRCIETQVSTGELSYGDRVYYTSPCALTTGILEFYDRTGDERYLDAAKEQISLVRNAPRVANGGISHNKDTPQLWVDSIYLMLPPIAQLGTRTGDQELYDEAAEQVIAHAEHLQDDTTSLYRHIWTETPNDYPEASFWGRGNGWAAAGVLDIIEHLPDDHEHRAELIEILNSQLSSVVDLQDDCGYWWNVLDDDTTFLETSVTTIFAYVLRRGIDLGIVSEEYEPAATRAFDAIAKSVNDEGIVTGATYVTTHNPNEQLTSTDVFSPSGYAQGWYLQTATYFLGQDRVNGQTAQVEGISE
jgi:unsaturated rhamnogalacturonyl hydrolase